MKTMTLSELNGVVEALQELGGAQFQDLGFDGSVFIIRLWSKGEYRDLILDLNPTCPALLLAMEPLGKIKRVKPTPLGLFLKSHFIGHRLVGASVVENLGRVVRLQWSGDPGGEMEIQLIPRAPNVTARRQDKSVSWRKPKPLSEFSLEKDRSGRSVEELWTEWRTSRAPTQAQVTQVAALSKAKSMWEREIQRLRKTVTKISSDIERRQSLPWDLVGRHLVATQSLEVPQEWKGHVDLDRPLAWNIENCFTQGKEQKRKLAGHRERLGLVETQLGELLALTDVESWYAGTTKKGASSSRRSKESAPRGRTLKLRDGIEAFAGKSAADNLAVLRQGRAWDLWVHLKDMPSSHAVVRRNKEQKVSDEDLREVGRWLVTLLSRPERFHGQNLEILVSECRHVRPIKGDRLGRVHFSNEKVLSFRTNEE